MACCPRYCGNMGMVSLCVEGAFRSRTHHHMELNKTPGTICLRSDNPFSLRAETCLRGGQVPRGVGAISGGRRKDERDSSNSSNRRLFSGARLPAKPDGGRTVMTFRPT